MSALLRHQVVVPACGDNGNFDDYEGHDIYLPNEVFEDMGRPDKITVTIEPGDTLNDVEPEDGDCCKEGYAEPPETELSAEALAAWKVAVESAIPFLGLRSALIEGGFTARQAFEIILTGIRGA